MAWIRTVDEADATGRLARIYEAAVRRAGKVFNILKVQSLRPETLDASMSLYLASMYSREGVGRAEREMIAVVVSRANDCHY